MILLIFLSVLFGTAFSSCPALKQAYQQAITESAQIGQADLAIAQNKLFVAPDDCGTVFFFQPPYPPDANDDFNRTTTLLLAERILSSSIENPNGKIIRDTLTDHSDCLDENLRCSTMPIKCPENDKFRTIDGSCNNKKNPKWGKCFTPYNRLQPVSFNDGVFEMRKSIVNKTELPGARHLSNSLFTRSPFSCFPAMRGNMGGVMYGQLIAHDLGMRQMYQTQEGGASRSCCNSDYSEPLSPQPFACHAIKYSKDDPYVNQLSPNKTFQCMNYIRSQMTFPNNCKLTGASPVNAVTHYLDASIVYGSENSVISQLRTFEDGKMKTNENNVLPRTCDDPNTDCYLSGDFRGTAFFTLGILQSIYHRLHNIIAVELKALNNHWDDERIFQEARRLNIAIHQNSVYTEWVRVFVGDKETKKFRPILSEYLGSYNLNTDASATNEFSHCIFRQYHANLNDKFELIDAKNVVIKKMTLEECDDGLKILEDQYDNVVRGLLDVPTHLSTFSAKVRNQMFNNNNKYNLGVDLISTDILIGRDLGLQPYYIYFELCTKKRVKSWDDLLDTIPAASVEDLKAIYASVYDVDSYVATALEDRCGSYLGTVGKCMAVMQFERSRSGDRYFYSLSNGANPFTRAQLAFIYKFTYANVLCATTGISEAPKNAFAQSSSTNRMIPCKRGLDLKAWKEN